MIVYIDVLIAKILIFVLILSKLVTALISGTYSDEMLFTYCLFGSFAFTAVDVILGYEEE